MEESFLTVEGQYDRLSGRCQGDLAGLRAYFSRLLQFIIRYLPSHPKEILFKRIKESLFSDRIVCFNYDSVINFATFATKLILRVFDF